MEQNFLIDEALQARKCARDAKKTFVLTNGCFDLLHAGHAYSLNQAALLGDTLWVAINSDDSVKALKGKDRPINCQKDRGYLLNSLKAVDGVFFFEKQNLAEEIKILEPDTYVKSADYSYETMNAEEKRALEEVGAKIVFVPMLNRVSSSSIIRKMKYSKKDPE